MPASDGPETRSSLLRKVRDLTDRQAWQEFFERYKPFIERYCRRLGVPAGDVDEVTQQVLIRVSVKMSLFIYDPGKGFRCWLRSIIRGTVLYYWRKLAQKRLDRGSGDSQILRQLEQVPCPDSLLDPMLEDVVAVTGPLRERLEQLQARVRASLRSDQSWQAFWLHKIEGYSTQEVAAMLGMEWHTAYRAIQRVCRRLRQEARKMNLSLPG